MSGSKKVKSPDEQRAERKRYVVRKTLENKYKIRFTIAKEGKMALNRRDYRMMIYRYTEYLKIMADTFEVTSIYDLKPSFFDAKKDVAELLLISQIFWELAKFYDGSSKTKDKQELCLKLFVRFTLGMQFQSLNSEIVRIELKRRKFKQRELIVKCLEGMYKESAGCYIATHYGSNDKMLSCFRSFKFNFLSNNSSGLKFIEIYYSFCFFLIPVLKRNPMLNLSIKIFITPLLFILYSILRILGYK